MCPTTVDDQNEVILIADDEKDFRDILTMSLESQGYKILEAEHGKHAYEIIEARAKTLGNPRIRIIISDWIMPGGNGIDLLNQIRSGPFKHTPFLLISGNVSKDQLLNAARQGADGVLLKPFSRDTLVLKLEESVLSRLQKLTRA